MATKGMKASGSMGITHKTKGTYGSTKSALGNKMLVGPLSKRPSKSR